MLDQLGSIDDVVARAMFGGVGLYAGSDFFAIVYHDIVYFKVDARARAVYERVGMAPFKPFADRPMTMQYYEVPANVLENDKQLPKQARRAIAVAKGKPTAKKARKLS